MTSGWVILAQGCGAVRPTVKLGQYKAALDGCQESVDLQPGLVAFLSMAMILRKLDRAPEAASYLTHAREVAASENEYYQACLKAIAGHSQAALTLLKQAFAKQPAARHWAAHDSAFESLRADPRFQVLLQE